MVTYITNLYNHGHLNNQQTSYLVQYPLTAANVQLQFFAEFQVRSKKCKKKNPVSGLL